MKQKKELSVSDLNKQFEDSKSVINEHLAEARTNVNLFVGNHFQKKGSRLSRSLDNLTDDKDVKIRVTKNHTNTICKYIINSILNQAPTGAILPKNPGEIQDQKSAEIHASIIEDYKIQNRFKAQVRRWAENYVTVGELFLNIFWDDNKGNLLGHEEVRDERTGEVTGTRPIFEGDAVTELVYAWDMRMDPGAKTFDEACWVGYEKMVDQNIILKLFGDTEENRKACKSDMDETYKVFDSTAVQYQDAKNRVLLRQCYYRPSTDYPDGYYVFFTKETIFAEGPLPKDRNGRVFFPIKYLGFDELPTSPRSISIIRQIRPDQMEVNRCASAIALTQMTMGFDKMIAPTGGEVDAGSMKAGVRVFRVPGGKQSADIIPGRSGEQFLNTMNSAISEMYRKTGVPENFDEKAADTDILASLYKNMRQKTRFSLYADKFGDFLVEIIEEVLRLKKAYMRDETFARVVGKDNLINIDEFRAMDDLGYQIKVEPATEDLESRFGKHIALTNTMQYLGQNLDQNTIGMLLKNLPFNNGEEIYSKFTIDYENARNILLALDRGEFPEVTTIEKPEYILAELNHRRRKPDFKFLDPRIQMNYLKQIEQYQAIYNQNLMTIQQAQAGFIPSDGPTVPVDGVYETVIGSNGQPKTQRVQLPLAAINDLIQKLQAQGNAFGNIQTLPLGQQAEMAQSFLEQSGLQPPAQGAPVGDMNGGHPSFV